jgi:hypothetical protein
MDACNQKASVDLTPLHLFLHEVDSACGPLPGIFADYRKLQP